MKKRNGTDGVSTNYEQMFGAPKAREVASNQLVPEMLPVAMRDDLIEAVMAEARRKKSWVLMFVIGTKPCFYKFFGAMKAAEAAGIPHLVLDSGQHYDPLLTYGSQEFGYHTKIAVNLQIRGGLAQKAGELFLKTSWLAQQFLSKWPDVTVMPVVLGDTILTTVVPESWLFTRNEKSIQNEAGLRSMAPDVFRDLARNPSLSLDKVIEGQFKGSWSRIANEPFPEQYDTFTSAAACQFHFAPVDLNRDNLLEEGHDAANIFVTGGVVVDALELKMSEKPVVSAFAAYPKLRQGRWLRMDIHRRENLTPRRFEAIIGGLTRLVQDGVNINFVEMNATKHALEQSGLRRKLLALAGRKNFLLTPVWPEYAQVIEFYRSEHCLGALTDSGGLQEELNMLGKVCMTVRFNTDRPETVRRARANVLVPPISAAFVHKMVGYVMKNPGLQERMRSAPKLYGSKVGAKFIQLVAKLMRSGARPFTWSHERLGFWKEKGSKRTML